jgi:hypothetical protein
MRHSRRRHFWVLISAWLTLPSCQTSAKNAQVEAQARQKQFEEMVAQNPQFSQGEAPQEKLLLPQLASQSADASAPAKTAPAPSAESPQSKVTASKNKAKGADGKADKPKLADKNKSDPKTDTKKAEPKTSVVAVPLQDINSDAYKACEVQENPIPAIARNEVHANTPYQPGEKAVYEVSYLGVLAGFGIIEVDAPVSVDGVWHQVLKAEAESGDWYKYVYVIHDKIVAWTRPWDKGLRRFYMEQDEGTMMGKRYISKKWVEFDHANCKAKERTQKKGKNEENKEFDLHRGSSDVLGAIFHLRALNYQIGKIQNIPVYTSEKNWVLEANPIAKEEIETPAGKFPAVKIKLQTYIGKDLQQKGDVHIWLADGKADQVMLQVKANVKVGSFWIRLKEFRPGVRL